MVYGSHLDCANDQITSIAANAYDLKRPAPEKANKRGKMDSLIVAVDTKVSRIIQGQERNIWLVKLTYLYLYSKLNERPIVYLHSLGF